MRGISGVLSPLIKKIRIKKALKFIKSGDKILDIGAGFGEIIKFLPEGVNYTGIEKNDYLFNFLKESFKDKKFYFGDANEKINKIEDKFDVILLLSVIEHLENFENFLKTLKEKLKDNGKILIYSPSPFSKFFLNFFSKLGLLSRFAADEHKKIYSLKELKKILIGNGYEIKNEKKIFFGLSYFLTAYKIKKDEKNTNY